MSAIGRFEQSNETHEGMNQGGMMNPRKSPLLNALLAAASLFLASCGCEDCVTEDYQCKDHTGAVVDKSVTVDKGESVYFGELGTDNSGNCVRRWHLVSPGGGSGYECYLNRNLNINISKSQPPIESWSYGICGEEGRPTTPAILEVTANGTIRWQASKSNKTGDLDGPPDEYFIVLSTFPISEELFNQKVSSRSHIVFVATENDIEEYSPSISSGSYFVRILAVSGTQRSNLSIEKPLTIASTAGVTFFPNPIPRSGLTRMKLILSAAFSGDFSDLTLRINTSPVTVNQDNVDKKVFYFTPPTPTDNDPLDVTIHSSGTGNISIAGGISVRQDNIEETHLVLEGFHVDVEESFSEIRKTGLTGAPAQERFLDLIHDNIQPGFFNLKKLWLARSYASDVQKLVGYIFDSHNLRAEKSVDALLLKLGPLAVAAAKQAAAEPQFGTATFFQDAKKRIADQGLSYFFVKVNDVAVVALEASRYNLKTYANSTAGNTIAEAVSANPNALILINGSFFNYKKTRVTPVHEEPLISTGLVIDDGVVQPTSCSVVRTATLGCIEAARSRWWFGQQFDGRYVHGGRVKSGINVLIEGHPPIPGSSPQATDLKAAIGGLYIYITDRSTQTGQAAIRHIVTPEEDEDLGTLYGFFGSFYGFGGMAYDMETQMLLVFSKQNRHKYSLKTFVTKLYDSGADWSVGTDGGSSTALGLNTGIGFDYPIRSRRHDASVRPNEAETITNYFIFSLK